MEDKDYLCELPNGWNWVAFSNLINKVKRGPSKKCNTQGRGIRYITSGNLQEGKLRLDFDYKFLDDFTEVEQCRLLPGDLILNCVNSLEQIGKSAVFHESYGNAIVGFNNYALELNKENILPEYANIVCQSRIFKTQIYFLIKRAINQVSFATKELQLIYIPLPPLNEQRRLVTKIESLKARTARVKDSLSTIPALLDQFRQSVLAAAFRGALTAEWREDNHYLTKDWYAKKVGSVREKNLETKKQGRLWGSGISVREVDVSWGQLPSTWNWVKVVDLGYNPDDVVQIGPMSMKSQDFTETGTKVLNVGCVQWDGLNLDKCNYLPPDRASDFDRYRVYKEDILFTRSGYVGRCAIVPPEVDGSLMTFHLLRVRTSPDICIPEYLYFAIRGCKAIKTQIEQSAIGATRAGFNTKLLQNIWIPLPPPQEQAQIIQEIKKQFKLLGSFNNQVNDIENTLNQLDQTILAQAFRGALVPQDPNDEPASVLLERIRASAEKNTGATSKRSKKNTDTSPKQSEKSTGATPKRTNKSTPFKEAVQMELELE